MVDDTCAPTKNIVVADDDRSSGDETGRNEAVFSRLEIVSQMAMVIDSGAAPDDGILLLAELARDVHVRQADELIVSGGVEVAQELAAEGVGRHLACEPSDLSGW